MTVLRPPNIKGTPEGLQDCCCSDSCLTHLALLCVAIGCCCVFPQAFQARAARAPEQCLRYCFKAGTPDSSQLAGVQAYCSHPCLMHTPGPLTVAVCYCYCCVLFTPQAFQARAARAPEQCLRYCFQAGAAPLWPSHTHRPSPGAVPACPHCGAERQFEFQVRLTRSPKAAVAFFAFLFQGLGHQNGLLSGMGMGCATGEHL
jgi:hypothetical protein